MKKAYLRVSTEKQNEIRQLKKVVEELGVEKIYLDKKTAKNKDREKLQEMLEGIEKDDVIYVHEISRLARSIVDLKQLVDEITSKGASVIFIKESMEFLAGEIEEENPIKNLMFNILGAFAEFERQIIVSRVREGVAIAKAEGKYKGRKTELCLGGKDESRYNAIVKALDEGMSIKEIRNIYKVGMGQIYRIKNEKCANQVEVEIKEKEVVKVEEKKVKLKEKKSNKDIIEQKLESLDFIIGCYDDLMEKLTPYHLKKVLENLNYGSTDIHVKIGKKKYVVEISEVDNEKDFSVIDIDEYISRYGELED